MPQQRCPIIMVAITLSPPHHRCITLLLAHAVANKRTTFVMRIRTNGGVHSCTGFVNGCSTVPGKGKGWRDDGGGKNENT